MKTLHALVAAILTTSCLLTHAAVITFTGATPGLQPSPYVVDGVQFGDSATAFVRIDNFPENNGDTALAAPTDDQSYLVMVFPTLSNFLSIDFGNDDPNLTQPGDLALLVVFREGSFVGQSTLALNRNDLVDQTILFSGLTFDSAVFAFIDSSPDQNPIALAEVIDNITYLPAPAPVPEPAILAVFGLGLLGLGLARRRT